MRPSKPQGMDVSPSGEWLFKLSELTLGPVTGAQLVDKLYDGEVGGPTLITPMGQEAWRPLKDVDGFKLHLAKAEAKLRVDASARTQRATAVRARNRRIGVGGVATLGVAIIAAWGARYLAVHNPWHQGSGEPEITVELPRITAAHSSAEEMVRYSVGGPKGGGAKHPGARGASGPGTHTEADGMEMAQVDQSAINSVVQAKQKTLYPCLMAEYRRNPHLADGPVPLEFALGNDGHVARLWVHLPDYREGPMVDCLLRELQKWPFKANEREGATVALNLQIHPRG